MFYIYSMGLLNVLLTYRDNEMNQKDDDVFSSSMLTVQYVITAPISYLHDSRTYSSSIEHATADIVQLSFFGPQEN